MFINSIRRASPFVVFLSLIVTFCVKDTVTEQELRKYVQEEQKQHGLRKKGMRVKNEVLVAYRPAELLVDQELSVSAHSVVVNKLHPAR